MGSKDSVTMICCFTQEPDKKKLRLGKSVEKSMA